MFLDGKKEKYSKTTQSAPTEYKQARYAYIDHLLVRIQREGREIDIGRLKVMYAPILDQIKNELRKIFSRANEDDLENTIYTKFLFLIFMYKPLSERKMSFSMWLKKYLKGWCYRMMNDTLGTGRKTGEVLASAIRDEDFDGNYADIIGAKNKDNPELDAASKTVLAKGIAAIRESCGEKAEDAFLCKHLYGMTQNEIADIIGCTQAKVSKILIIAEEEFRKHVTPEDFDVTDLR